MCGTEGSLALPIPLFIMGGPLNLLIQFIQGGPSGRGLPVDKDLSVAML